MSFDCKTGILHSSTVFRLDPFCLNTRFDFYMVPLFVDPILLPFHVNTRFGHCRSRNGKEIAVPAPVFSVTAKDDKETTAGGFVAHPLLTCVCVCVFETLLKILYLCEFRMFSLLERYLEMIEPTDQRYELKRELKGT